MQNMDSTQQQQAGGSCICLALGPAIAAIVIASQYEKNDSPCGPISGVEQEYTVDLVTFLNVAGYLTCAWVGLYVCCVCGAKSGSIETQAKVQQAIGLPACCYLLFNLAWAGIGLYMYEDEFSVDCQDTPIGTMIFAWSLIQYVSLGVLVCCMICMCFCAGGMMAMMGRDA